jgi:hypothetical protein
MSAIEDRLEKHELHIYERSFSNKEIYRCIHPDCTHYTRRELLIGKRAECCKCHQPFIISKSQLKVGQKKSGRKNLVCFTCTKSPKAAVAKEVADVLDDIFTQQDEKDEDLIFPMEGI